MKKYIKAKLPDFVYKKNNYKKVNYTGLNKVLYSINHKLLEINVNDKFNHHILEVGGGAEPHINFMNLKNIKSYTILDSIKFKKQVLDLKKLKKIKKNNIKIFFLNYKKKNSFKKKNYTRLISSHTFEHFENFEDNFLKLMPLLKKNALISTALPCDPGIVWRFLQYLSYIKQKKIYQWKNFREKDLDDSRDHITPVQNILKVMRYYFKNIQTIYFPLWLPLINFNIFLIIQTKLSDFKD